MSVAVRYPVVVTTDVSVTVGYVVKSTVQVLVFVVVTFTVFVMVFTAWPKIPAGLPARLHVGTVEQEVTVTVW